MIQNKMIRNQPPKVNIEKFLPPLPISNNHKHINFNTVFLNFNEHTFLQTKPGKVNLLSVQYFISRSAYKIINGIYILKQTYKARVFEIDNIFGDNELYIQNLKISLLPTKLHTHAKDEHVGIVEISTLTIKERAICTCHYLP